MDMNEIDRVRKAIETLEATGDEPCLTLSADLFECLEDDELDGVNWEYVEEKVEEAKHINYRNSLTTIQKFDNVIAKAEQGEYV